MSGGRPAKELADETKLAPAPLSQSYKVRIAELANELSTRCKTHAYLVEIGHIQDVIDEIAELLDHLDEAVMRLDPNQGPEIKQWQALRKLADGIRNRCFSLADGFTTYGTGMKPPEFYDLLTPLPVQLFHLARLLPIDFPIE
ncbi:MAG: hypothetical protein H8D43_01010 [Chloroflexi bacterium]|nr:hypothetical protein [Chloroflexota bacterium]